jgi:hypothetical protein
VADAHRYALAVGREFQIADRQAILVGIDRLAVAIYTAVPLLETEI